MCPMGPCRWIKLFSLWNRGASSMDLPWLLSRALPLVNAWPPPSPLGLLLLLRRRWGQVSMVSSAATGGRRAQAYRRRSERRADEQWFLPLDMWTVVFCFLMVHSSLRLYLYPTFLSLGECKNLDVTFFWRYQTYALWVFRIGKWKKWNGWTLCCIDSRNGLHICLYPLKGRMVSVSGLALSVYRHVPSLVTANDIINY